MARCLDTVWTAFWVSKHHPDGLLDVWTQYSRPDRFPDTVWTDCQVSGHHPDGWQGVRTAGCPDTVWMDVSGHHLDGQWMAGRVSRNRPASRVSGHCLATDGVSRCCLDGLLGVRTPSGWTGVRTLYGRTPEFLNTGWPAGLVSRHHLDRRLGVQTPSVRTAACPDTIWMESTICPDTSGWMARCPDTVQTAFWVSGHHLDGWLGVWTLYRRMDRRQGVWTPAGRLGVWTSTGQMAGCPDTSRLSSRCPDTLQMSGRSSSTPLISLFLGAFQQERFLLSGIILIPVLVQFLAFTLWKDLHNMEIHPRLYFEPGTTFDTGFSGLLILNDTGASIDNFIHAVKSQNVFAETATGNVSDQLIHNGAIKVTQEKEKYRYTLMCHLEVVNCFPVLVNIGDICRIKTGF
uniref:Uncharacterized protein n=1 Tax=Sphaerodactylus townsendi TaxID=933632 RepID=A0ACB8EKW0_9SAUR